MVAGIVNLAAAVAINGDEELSGVHGETATEHITTRGRHRERERSTVNSPRRLSSTVRHEKARAMAEQMAMGALGLRRVAKLKRGGVVARLGLGEGGAMRPAAFKRRKQHGAHGNQADTERRRKRRQTRR